MYAGRDEISPGSTDFRDFIEASPCPNASGEIELRTSTRAHTQITTKEQKHFSQETSGQPSDPPVAPYRCASAPTPLLSTSNEDLATVLVSILRSDPVVVVASSIT